MDIHYCEGWFRARKVATCPFTEDQAREAYHNRKLYTALIGDKVHPQCFVESNMDYIGVEFLDEHLREHVCYQFSEDRPGMLFLSMAVYRWYEGNTDKVASAVIYYYKEDGTAIVHKSFAPQEGEAEDETYEANITVDLRPNWEPYPEFGQYESITRKDRGLKLIH